MIRPDELSNKIFSVLRGHGLKLSLFTSEGMETVDPSEARRFFSKSPVLMVTVDESDDAVVVSMGDNLTFAEIETLSDQMKMISIEYLTDYTIRKFNKTITPRDFAYQGLIAQGNAVMTPTTVTESIAKLFGTKYKSFQKVEEVKILINHKKPVAEEKRGARSRNINSIFIECNGERFKMPTNKVLPARAMARHLSYGGNFNDAVGSHITETAKKYDRLGSFIKYATKNNLINESTYDTILAVKDTMEYIINQLKRLSNKTQYSMAAESMTAAGSVAAATPTTDEKADDIKDMFTVRYFSEDFNDVLPIVKSIVTNRNAKLEELQDAVSKPILISCESIVCPDSANVKFQTPSDELSFRLNGLANAIHNVSIASFLRTTSKKISKNEPITKFEESIMHSVLENCTSTEPFSSTELAPEEANAEYKLVENIIRNIC